MSAASTATWLATSFALAPAAVWGWPASRRRAAWSTSRRAASRRAAISASGNWTPWKRAIGPPKAVRSRAYDTASSSAARAMPSAWAAIMIRPESSVESATFRPLPSVPSIWPAADAVAVEGQLDRGGGVQAELRDLAARP